MQVSSELTPEQWRANRVAASKELPDVKTEMMHFALYGLGIAGEAGEVADHIKKCLFHGQEFDKEHLLEECGDVLWYLDRILYRLGYTLEECMKVNDDKLAKRYPDGFVLGGGIRD